jgi:hypothetical protein
MIRRLYVLLMLLCTLLATVVYGFAYVRGHELPATDPTGKVIQAMEDYLPPVTLQWVDRVLEEARVRQIDVRWAFLACFLLFYVQFYLRRRPRPRTEREAELLRRKRGRARRAQVRGLFLAVLLVTVLVGVVEWIRLCPEDQIQVFGRYTIMRGEPEAFRRNVYHYALLLVVAHLLAYILLTWLLLGFAALRGRRREGRVAAEVGA